MARIRTIKPEFPKSESIGRLSHGARLLFLQLFMVVDDEGRARAAPRLLLGELYPYDDGEEGRPQATQDDIDGWLRELERERKIRRYSVNGAHFLDIPTWGEHQKIGHPSKSRLPAFHERLMNNSGNAHEPLTPYLGPRTSTKDQERGLSSEDSLSSTHRLADEWATPKVVELPRREALATLAELAPDLLPKRGRK